MWCCKRIALALRQFHWSSSIGHLNSGLFTEQRESPYKQSFKKPCEPKALWLQNPLYKSDFKLVFKLKRYVHLLQRRQWQPTPGLLPGKSHGRRSLVGCSPWGPEELDMTEQLHFHFSLSCIGEGNSNPLQCSCLENPRDGGAWWAAVYGVAQSWTQLKRLNSSSSSTSVMRLVIDYGR